MTITVTPKNVKTILSRCIAGRIPVMLTGAPGVGKSDIVAQAAEAAGADVILSHPAVSDPTDAKGLPWPDQERGRATFLPFGDLARALEATKPTVWFLDDLGQATPAVQASFMQLLLARQVNDHALPDCVTFVAATNRRADRAGVQGILEPVKSRFGTIVELQPSLDDWVEWAYQNDIPAEVIAFLRFKSTMLLDFNPTADMENSPCPRTWSHVAKLVQLGLPKGVELAAIAGAVGEGAATEFVSYLGMFRDLPDIDLLLDDPYGQPLPEELNVQFAVASSMAARASKENFGRVVKYALRLHENRQSEFGVMMLTDAIVKDSMLSQTKAFREMTRSSLGKLIIGQRS